MKRSNFLYVPKDHTLTIYCDKNVVALEPVPPQATAKQILSRVKELRSTNGLDKI